MLICSSEEGRDGARQDKESLYLHSLEQPTFIAWDKIFFFQLYIVAYS